MPNTFLGHLSSKEAVKMEKSKKKLSFQMYDDFHAHLVVTNLKTQKSSMHKKLKERVKKSFSYILTAKRCRTSMFTEFTLMRCGKDMFSTISWKWFYCFESLADFQTMQKSFKVLKFLQSGFKISFYTSIYQQF